MFRPRLRQCRKCPAAVRNRSRPGPERSSRASRAQIQAAPPAFRLSFAVPLEMRRFARWTTLLRESPAWPHALLEPKDALRMRRGGGRATTWRALSVSLARGAIQATMVLATSRLRRPLCAFARFPCSPPPYCSLLRQTPKVLAAEDEAAQRPVHNQRPMDPASVSLVRPPLKRPRRPNTRSPSTAGKSPTRPRPELWF